MLDLVATAVEHKGDGHCRALLQALEGWLGPELGVAKLVAVCPADVSGHTSGTKQGLSSAHERILHPDSICRCVLPLVLI